jgi:RNA polymerase sigma-70 factor (ECF subfamily)
LYDSPGLYKWNGTVPAASVIMSRLEIPADNKFATVSELTDEKVFEELFLANKNAIFTFCFRTVGSKEDAEDIVQETFCRAWRSVGAFRGDCSVRTWLYRIATNVCKNHLASPKRKTSNTTDSGLDLQENEALSIPANSIESFSLTKSIVQDALNELPASHRMLVILCDVQGFTCEEAARMVGCSSISVRVRLNRARKKLRKLLTGLLDEGE